MVWKHRLPQDRTFGQDTPRSQSSAKSQKKESPLAKCDPVLMLAWRRVPPSMARFPNGNTPQQFNGSIMFNPVPFLGLKCAIFPQDQYWLVVSTFNPSEQ